MLALTTSTLSFSAAPALAAVRTSAGVSMRQSEALPFLEAPPQLDGTLAGDVVRRHFPRASEPDRGRI